MNIFNEITAYADEMSDELIRIRRDFHKFAEAGWHEMRTSSIIARILTDLGYEVLVGEDVCKRDARMGVPSDEVLEASYERAVAQGADSEFVPYTKGGMTGVIGILRRGEGPVIAMRFDIDALGVNESSDEEHVPLKAGFASVNPGVMHACGHDGHAAIGIGVAKLLMKIKDNIHGTVKLIFQPSEEGVRGAKAIVENGHLDDVNYLLGAHISGAAKNSTGEFYAGSYGALATTKYDVYFHGRAAHAAAHPQSGNNVLLAAATAVLNLYAIPRHSKGETRINVGTLHAGSGRNVIADEAKLEIEVRGETGEINDYVSDYAVRIIENAAKMHGCTCEIKVMGAAIPLKSDIDLCERIAKVVGEELGIPAHEKLTTHSAGSEDFSYMMKRVQERGGKAVFIRPTTPCADVAHSRRFDFNESVLAKQVKIFCAMVVELTNE